jgi:hypothetical protein
MGIGKLAAERDELALPAGEAGGGRPDRLRQRVDAEGEGIDTVRHAVSELLIVGPHVVVGIDVSSTSGVERPDAGDERLNSVRVCVEMRVRVPSGARRLARGPAHGYSTWG